MVLVTYSIGPKLSAMLGIGVSIIIGPLNQNSGLCCTLVIGQLPDSHCTVVELDSCQSGIGQLFAVIVKLLHRRRVAIRQLLGSCWNVIGHSFDTFWAVIG